MSRKGRARTVLIEFIGAWPPNESKRFFFIRNNFEYVDRDGGFSTVVVNQKPMSSQSRDPHVLKGQMDDAAIARREVPLHFKRAAENGEFQKVIEAMAKEGRVKYETPIQEVQVSEELPSELEGLKPAQPELFDPEQMRRTRRPFGHWRSWYGRATMNREGAGAPPVGQDVDNYEGSAPPFDWNARDNYGVWNAETVAKLLGVEPDKYVYRAMLDLGELDPRVVELEDAKNIRGGAEEVEDVYLDDARDMLEEWGSLESLYAGTKFEEWRNALPWVWGEGYDEEDVLELAREMQARDLERSDLVEPGVFGSGFPPVVVTRRPDGALVVNDGNHRVESWRRQEFDVAPAWVNDELLRQQAHRNRSASSESQARINEAVEAWEWEEDMTPEQFATALREAGADPKYADLGSLGKYITAAGDVYDVEYHDSGKSIADFLWGLSDFELMQYAEENGFSSDAWNEVGHDDVAYHCTDAKNVPSIMKNGIEPRNLTRGLDNRSTGAAVFMSFEPMSAESYGDVCFQIHLGAMKDAGHIIQLEQEEPIIDAKIRGAIAHRLGYEGYSDWGESELSSGGVEENTLVAYGTIPPQFISLYSGPEELMEQYASASKTVKTAVEDYEIEDYVGGLREPYYEMTNIEQLDPETELDDDDWTGSNLYDVLHDVFEWSAKIAMWKASGSPMHERKIENLTDRMERYADLAITYIKAKMQDWLDNHFDWDKWWSGMAYAYMANGQDIRSHFGTTYPIDIREEITTIAQQRMFDQVYSFIEEFPDEKVYWLKANPEVCAAFAKAVQNDPYVEEWLQNENNDPDDICDDPEEFIYDCNLDTALNEFAYEHEEAYEQFIREHYAEIGDFDQLKMMFDVGTWGEIVEEAAKQADAYRQWKEIFPGLEEIEEGIQKAVSMLESAQTPDQKVAALSYALNVQHYFGNVMRERMEDESMTEKEMEELTGLVEKIEEIAPLDYEQLEVLSNIEVVAAGKPVDRTAQTWYRGQVFVDRGETYSIDRLIEIVSKNHVVKIPVEDLRRQLFDDAWGENGAHLSPMEVLNNPTKDKVFVEHMQDIRTADMEHPVIIRKEDMMIVDGYHRLARAFLEGRPWIKAVFAEPEQMNEARVV